MRWAPICIFLNVSGQNESVHLKSIDTLYYDVIDVKNDQNLKRK